MAAIREAIVDILIADNPQTVRQVFYQLVARSLIEKTEHEYQSTVIRLLRDMRFDEEVDWDWIIDDSRRIRNTRTFDTVTDAINQTAEYYRRSALEACPDYIQIWCEKEALAGIIWDAASDYDVPVIPSKGMPSLTLVYNCFREIERASEAGKDCYLYQFGDHDPTGVLIPQSLEQRMAEFCERYNCPLPTIERVALTEQQILDYSLPTRPTKVRSESGRPNPHLAGFEGDSVELDALPSSELRKSRH
jgi:hypothetical protein